MEKEKQKVWLNSLSEKEKHNLVNLIYDAADFNKNLKSDQILALVERGGFEDLVTLFDKKYRNIEDILQEVDDELYNQASKYREFNRHDYALVCEALHNSIICKLASKYNVEIK